MIRGQRTQENMQACMYSRMQSRVFLASAFLDNMKEGETGCDETNLIEVHSGMQLRALVEILASEPQQRILGVGLFMRMSNTEAELLGALLRINKTPIHVVLDVEVNDAELSLVVQELEKSERFVKALTIHAGTFGDVGGEALFDAIGRGLKVHRVDMTNGHSMACASLRNLGQALSKHSCVVEELSLNWCVLNTGEDSPKPDHFLNLFKGIQENRSLCEITCYYEDFAGSTIWPIFQDQKVQDAYKSAIKLHPTLQNARFSQLFPKFEQEEMEELEMELRIRTTERRLRFFQEKGYSLLKT